LQRIIVGSRQIDRQKDVFSAVAYLGQMVKSYCYYYYYYYYYC